MIGFGVDHCSPPPDALPMAILRHETPDGGAHFDLLLADQADVDDDSRTIPTWRCERDPMSLAPGERMRAERLAPHRGLYLRLTATRTLDGDRGLVLPTHRGWHRTQGDVRVLCTDRGTSVSLRLAADRLERCDAIDQVNAS